MKKKLNIIFFGSSNLSVEVLRVITKAGYPVSGVVTQPDKRAGRHLKLQETPVKNFSESLSLKIFTPSNLKDETFKNALTAIPCDLFIVVAYGLILPAEILKIPKLYPVNIHASLLPEYRGAAPIQHAIIDGKTQTGISIIRMNEKMDEGDIISQAKVSIDITDNSVSLEKKLACLASQEILEVLKSIEDGSITFSKQDSRKATFAPKLTKNSGLIDWQSSAEAIFNQIRACLPWPVAFTYFKGKRIRIFSAQIAAESKLSAKPGEIISLNAGSITVATGKSSLKIIRLQPESSRQLEAREFISGSRLKAGEIFS